MIAGARRWRGATPAARAYGAALAALIATGTWLRISGALTTPLWDDEARQAVALAGELDHAHLAAWPLHLRPILYLMIGKASISVHDAAWVLRLIALIPSIAALALTAPLARLVLASRVAVVACVGWVALSPWLIDFAKEYKPYALEHGLVTLACYLALAYLARRRRATLYALAAVSALSPLLGFACVFVTPLLLAIVALDARRRHDRPAQVIAACGGALAIGLFAAQYALFQHHASQASFRYWADNFYDRGFSLGHLVTHTFELAGRFAAGPVVWSDRAGWSTLLAVGNALLFAAGLAALIARRRWPVVAVIAGPLVLALGASLLGRWPYGMVRVNLYAIGLVVLAWGAAVDFAMTSPRLRRPGLAALAALAALEAPLAPDQLLAKQIPASHMRPALTGGDMPRLLDALLAADPGAPAPACVHVSAEARAAFTYYATLDESTAPGYAPRLRVARYLGDNTRTAMQEMDAALRGDAQPCWLVRSYRYDEQLAARRATAGPGMRVLAEVSAPGLYATAVERRAPVVRAADDGAVTLRAGDAILVGEGLWYYGRPRIGGLQGVDPHWAGDALGHWGSAAATPRWTFELARPAELAIAVSQAAGPDAGASDYEVAIDDRAVRGRVQPTASWREFAAVPLGALPVAAGRHVLAVRITALRGADAMNLRAVTLTPVSR